ncbi:MAG: hypothetical protein QUS33_10170 [Dehalococcoidia bacterium]|nr:hypothetical protein [Dehalococcoidia bacterium]
MRITRGCGCLLLILAAVNVVFLIGAIIGLATHQFETWQIGLLAVAVFGANLVPSVMMGLAGVRSVPIGGGPKSGSEDVGPTGAEESDSSVYESSEEGRDDT